MLPIEHLQDHIWVRPSYYMGFSPDGDYLIYSKNRDSSLLEVSNFERIEQELEKLEKPENEKMVYTFRASCSMVGYIDYLLVSKDADNDLLTLAGEIICAISDYPVFDESHYSELQYNTVFEYWENLSIEDRVDLCNDNEVSIFKARHDDQVPCEVEQYLLDTMFY